MKIRNLIYGMTILVIMSCANEVHNTKEGTYTKEEWYRIYKGNKSEKPMKEVYYNQQGQRVMEVSWMSSAKSYKTVRFYNENDSYTKVYSFFDTTYQSGTSMEFIYENNALVEQTIVNFLRGMKPDTQVVKMINTLDGNDKVAQTLALVRKDTMKMEFLYDDKGNITEQRNILPDGTVREINTRKYNSDGLVIESIVDFVNKNKTKTLLYNYNDTLLVTKYYLDNSDTIKTEYYNYKDGLKTSIEIKYVDREQTIEIERSEVNELPQIK